MYVLVTGTSWCYSYSYYLHHFFPVPTPLSMSTNQRPIADSALPSIITIPNPHRPPPSFHSPSVCLEFVACIASPAVFSTSQCPLPVTRTSSFKFPTYCHLSIRIYESPLPIDSFTPIPPKDGTDHLGRALPHKSRERSFFPVLAPVLAFHLRQPDALPPFALCIFLDGFAHCLICTHLHRERLIGVIFGVEVQSLGHLRGGVCRFFLVTVGVDTGNGTECVYWIRGKCKCTAAANYRSCLVFDSLCCLRC